MFKAAIQYQGMPKKAGEYLVKYGYAPIDNLGNKRWYVALVSTQRGLTVEVEVRSQAKALAMVKGFVALFGGN